MSERRRNWSAKSTSSLEEIPEAHLAKLRRQLQEREKKKSQGEVPRHDVPREPPLSPSSRARAEEERIHKLYPILPGCLVEKYGMSSYVQREAELSAASRPAVAPTPDVVWVPLQATTTDEVPCPVPHSSQNISCPAVTHCNQLSTSKESSTASTSTISDYGLRVQKLVDLQSEEQRGRDRIAVIDRTMEDLHSERKALTDKVLSLKQEQYELLLSTTPDHPFARVSASRSSEATATISKTPAATESAQPIEESSPAQPIPPAASTELLSLMHQLEENGLHRDMEVPSDPVTVSVGTKRRRIPSGESESKKMKRTTTSSPSRNGVDIPPVEKLEQVPTNGAVVQSMQPIGTLAVPQTLSISQSDQISLTISSVMSQSVESSCPKKTPTPAIFSDGSKNAASPSVSSLTEESQDQTKEISTGKAQTGYSSTKVVEPTVPQPKVAELKVAERLVHPKVVKSKAADPKIVQTKKSTAANDTKSTQKPTDANSRSLENCRTSSRREESSTQKASPKFSKVNAQPSEAASKLPAPATESNPAKDTAAATASKSTAACEIVSTHPVLLPPHPTAVKCVDIHGPCAFTASEDGTVHIYDLKTNSLVKKIFGHTHPVTWLYATSLNTSSEVLSTIKSTIEYLNRLTLVTGSEDKHIRQFALDSGSSIHERFCNYTPTCESGTRTRRNLVGTKEGVILSYDTKAKSIMRINKFQVNGEVICMKIISIRRKGAIIIAVRQMEPVVFDLQTGNTLFKLASNIPNTSFYCISSSSRYVFCCDANKNMFKFDTHSDNIYQTETLPSAAVSSFYDGKRFLVLGCMDGVIRVMDIRHKQPYPMFTLPGQGLKTLACMEVVGDTIVGGSLNGEVFYCRLPNLEALRKASHY